ncbi:MAG: type II toxin-antitoxin system RelE/ParE family toxin [Spirochaetes bacterium]|nr:type II toxin-antitoxin system RelE/ParE family toxin [Spirochaetota bacterium]
MNVIQSFASKGTEDVFNGVQGRRAEKTCPAALQANAARKLDLLDAAVDLDDLKIPPGNRLEALAGDRKGQFSIRINDQFRICFRWSPNGPSDVEIVDYH